MNFKIHVSSRVAFYATLGKTDVVIAHGMLFGMWNAVSTFDERRQVMAPKPAIAVQLL